MPHDQIHRRFNMHGVFDNIWRPQMSSGPYIEVSQKSIFLYLKWYYINNITVFTKNQIITSVCPPFFTKLQSSSKHKGKYYGQHAVI